VLADVFGKEPQDEVSVFLQQLILTPIRAIGLGTFQVLQTVQLDRHLCFLTEQVYFHAAASTARSGRLRPVSLN
jgi:hypothetical protein